MFERKGHRGPLAAMAERVRERLPQGIKQALPAIGQLRTREGRDQLLFQTRQSCFKLADDTVRAVSAGMGIADVRAIFRGDPPVEKPDPRVKVFTNAFFAHIRPRYYEKGSTRFTHTFALGFLSALSFVIEGLTGLFLMVYYIPGQDGAYQSTVKIVTEVPFGQLMRDIHRVGADLMVIFVALHMFRVFLTGSFKHPRQFTWLTGVVLLILTLGLSFSGYLLPWDQLAYWGVTIATGMAKSAPPKEIVGTSVNLLLRGGDAIGQNGLLRFYLGHVVLLPLLAAIFLSVHYYRVARVHGISLPAGEEESPDPAVRQAAKEHVEYLPELLTRELMWIAMGVFAIVAFAVFVFHSPLGQDSDPLHAPLQISVPWYLLWIQGMLKDPFVLPLLRALRDYLRIDLVRFYDSATWQGVILPAAMLAILFAVPYVDELWDRLWGRESSRMGRNRKLSLSLGFLSVALLGLFTYFGTLLYGVTVPPPVEISLKYIPKECALPPLPLLPENCGEVRRLGYARVPVGVYDLSQYSAIKPNADSFVQMLAQMQGDIAEQATLALATNSHSGLPDARGLLIVEDWQTNLKKITLRITWTPVKAGDAGSFEQVVYLHRDSEYR